MTPPNPAHPDSSTAATSAMDARALDERRQRLFDSLSAQPWAHDFFAILRQIEGVSPTVPRLGSALRPSAEPIRLGQDPELDFAPAALMSFDPGGRPRLGVRFFGLFGSMGALPLHLTEFARDRLRNHADPTFARFVDMFHHRALLLFYRAWSQSQPTVQADRPADDRFAGWVSALFGHRPATLRHADAVPDAAKRFVSGHLARSTRSAETISKVLRQFFKIPLRVESYVGHWMPLRREDCTRLGSAAERRSAPLGISAVAGSRIWDRQYKLRLHLGPLTLEQYQQFLPGQRSLIELRDWMRQLLGFEMFWDLRLILMENEVPSLQVGKSKDGGAAPTIPLGWATWLGGKGASTDRGDLRLHPAHLGACTFNKGNNHG